MAFFFATSHRNSPGNGIGDTTKRLIAGSSLQKTLMLNINAMYEWSTSHIDGIKFFKVTESDAERQ